MIFSAKTLQVGGKILVPDSMVNNVDEGIIEDVRQRGIVVKYDRHNVTQRAYYAYDWLNQQYGSFNAPARKDPPTFDDALPDFC